MTPDPVAFRPPCPMTQAVRLRETATWTEADWTNLSKLGTAYAHLTAAYADLDDENQRLAERRLWRDVGSFLLGVLAMAVVVVLGRL